MSDYKPEIGDVVIFKGAPDDAANWSVVMALSTDSPIAAPGAIERKYLYDLAVWNTTAEKLTFCRKATPWERRRVGLDQPLKPQQDAFEIIEGLVDQACSDVDGHRVHHSSISAYEDAFDFLMIEDGATVEQLHEAIERKRREPPPSGKAPRSADLPRRG